MLTPATQPQSARSERAWRRMTRCAAAMVRMMKQFLAIDIKLKQVLTNDEL